MQEIIRLNRFQFFQSLHIFYPIKLDGHAMLKFFLKATCTIRKQLSFFDCAITEYYVKF